jgi:transglutaminase-like putative cysteine protease
MSFRSNHIKLNLGDQGNKLIFPIPQSNQYQDISSLKYSDNSEIIKEEKFGNSIAIFKTSSKKQRPFLSFTHQAHEVSYDINKLQILLEKDKIDKGKKAIADDKYISANDPQIKELNQKFLGDRTLSPEQIVSQLYHKLLDYLEYGNPIDGLYPYSAAISDRKTDCGGFATLLASLLKANGISSRLVVGYLFSKKKKTLLKKAFNQQLSLEDLSMHAWLEIPSSAGYFPLDPSIEWKRLRGLSKRKGGFGYLPADRLVLSYGHNFPLKIDGENYQFPILQHPEKIK